MGIWKNRQPNKKGKDKKIAKFIASVRSISVFTGLPWQTIQLTHMTCKLNISFFLLYSLLKLFLMSLCVFVFWNLLSIFYWKYKAQKINKLWYALILKEYAILRYSYPRRQRLGEGGQHILFFRRLAKTIIENNN